MRLALIRHPAIEVPAGTCYGRTDYPLADPAEIGAIVGRLGAFRPQAVIASPAGRCRALAEAVAAGRPAYDPRLLELDFGQWEGRAWAGIDRAELDLWAADPLDRAPPGGETGRELIARITACFTAIVARGVDQAVVTHGGSLKVLCALVGGHAVDLFAPAPALGSVTLVEVHAQG